MSSGLLVGDRFGLNWFKLRLWEMEDFDGVLYLDSDTEVLGNVSAVFQLPTDFATVLDANKEGYSCAPVSATIFPRT